MLVRQFVVTSYKMVSFIKVTADICYLNITYLNPK